MNWPLSRVSSRTCSTPPAVAFSVGVGVPGVIVPGDGDRDNWRPSSIRGGMNGAHSSRDCRSNWRCRSVLENDVNAAALGEQHARGKDCPSNFVFVSVGGGIGAGLIFEGRLYRGSRNAAGEIGYMIVDGNRPKSRGEFGGLERIASCPALLARARALGWSAPSVPKTRLDDAIRQLGRAAQRRDVSRRTRPWMKARTLGAGLGQYCFRLRSRPDCFGGRDPGGRTMVFAAINRQAGRSMPLAGTD